MLGIIFYITLAHSSQKTIECVQWVRSADQMLGFRRYGPVIPRVLDPFGTRKNLFRFDQVAVSFLDESQSVEFNSLEERSNRSLTFLAQKTGDIDIGDHALDYFSPSYHGEFSAFLKTNGRLQVRKEGSYDTAFRYELSEILKAEELSLDVDYPRLDVHPLGHLLLVAFPERALLIILDEKGRTTLRASFVSDTGLILAHAAFVEKDFILISFYDPATGRYENFLHSLNGSLQDHLHLSDYPVAIHASADYPGTLFAAGLDEPGAFDILQIVPKKSDSSLFLKVSNINIVKVGSRKLLHRGRIDWLKISSRSILSFSFEDENDPNSRVPSPLLQSPL